MLNYLKKICFLNNNELTNSNDVFNRILNILEKIGSDYKLFSHREALTWQELSEVQKETGFFGTELKCMVLNADQKLLIYVTLSGNRLSFNAIKKAVGSNKIRLSTTEELQDYFKAKPGCAYPFGFDAKYDIYVDPQIYKQEWLLFGPAIPTKTVQVRGSDMKRIFATLDNSVREVDYFNQ